MALPQQTSARVNPPTPAQTAASLKDSLTDRSQYIRTMAKDLAALATGNNTPTARIQHAPLPRQRDQQTETIGGVTLAVEEQPFFERQLPRREKELQEAVALPSMEEAGAIVETTAHAPEQPSTLGDERSSVLDRLRARAQETTSNQQEPVLPQFNPAPFVTPDQSFQDLYNEPVVPTVEISTGPAPFLPVSRSSTPAPTIEAVLPRENTKTTEVFPEFATAGDRYREPLEDGLPIIPDTRTTESSGLQTYSGDFADRLDSRGASAFSVLAAEQDMQPGTAVSPENTRRGVPRAVVIVITGLLLFALGGGGVYAVYRIVMTMRATPIAALTVPSIVFADEYRELSGTGSVLIQSLGTSANAALLPGNVLITYVLSSATDEEGTVVERPVGGGRLFRSMQIPAPDILTRNITDDGSVGVIHAGNETRAFFALRVDSYERTFAGMLTWEPLMFRDLETLFPLHPARTDAPLTLDTSSESLDTNSTTTATTTVSTSTPSAPPRPVQATARTRFEDAVIANHDVRILRDTDGEALMVYGYADKRTLIIARNEAAFEDLLPRLKSE